MRSLLVCFLFACTAVAQVTDAKHLGEPVVLTDNWRFHAGDSLLWAQPDFDDAAWRLMSAAESWDEQRMPQVRGFFWYRTRVRLAGPSTQQLNLLIDQVGPYEVFADGKRVGEFGSMPPHWRGYRNMPKLFQIPSTQSGPTVIAIRFWLWPQVTQVWGYPGTVIVGTKTVMDQYRELLVSQEVEAEFPTYVDILLWLLLSIGLIILFLLQPDRNEYLWLALAGIFTAANGIRSDYQSLVGLDIVTAGYFAAVAGSISAICILEFVFRFLREPMPKWLRIYQAIFPLTIVWLAIHLANWTTPRVFDTGSFLFRIPYWFAPPCFVLWRYLRGNKEAGLLAIPLLLIFLNEMLDTVRWVLWLLKLRHSSDPFVGEFQFGLVSVRPEAITHFLFLLSVAALILHRFQKTRSEQVRAHAELEAARSMQEVMVPTSVAATGFRIDSAYLPAQEVGGDFFQLFPAEDGSLLVVIGDVSGKGVRAAMLVSLILGLLRRTVAQTRDPAQVLSDVNAFLTGHTDGKFATCCCALLLPDGSMTVANAGHLSPYCDGEEMEIPGGLPLGLSAEAGYEAIAFRGKLGRRWVFVSDGVVEARSKSGELYGFERTRTISVQTVNAIAESARRFGQEDDITVLGVERQEVAFA